MHKIKLGYFLYTIEAAYTQTVSYIGSKQSQCPVATTYFSKSRVSKLWVGKVLGSMGYTTSCECFIQF